MATGPVVDWEELKNLVQSNDIASLRRSDETLQTYRRYKADLINRGESIFSRLIFDALEWGSPDSYQDLQDIDDLPKKLQIIPTDPRLFGNPQDIKILRNDFPYHFEPNVIHLVVWSKVNIKADPNSSLGDISSKTRAIIDRYVEKTFHKALGIPQNNIIWFRNWTALQSVKNISHVHVIVRDLPHEKLSSLLGQSGVAIDYDNEDRDLDYSEYKQ